MQIPWVKLVNGVRGPWSAWHIVCVHLNAMPPKSAQNRVAALQQQGLSLSDARSQLKSEGFSKSRVSQLLKGYAVAAAAVPAAAHAGRDAEQPDVAAATGAAAGPDSDGEMPAGRDSSSESDARTRLPFDGSL